MVHSGKRLRRGLARHKKASIVVGTTVGLVAAASVAFAVTVLGGNITGTIQSNGSQPAVQWVDQSDSTAVAPAYTGCSLDGTSDTSATGSASLVPDPDGVEQDVDISLSNVWAGEVCTFSGYLAESDGNTGNEVTVSGISLYAQVGGSTTETALTTSLNSGAVLTLENGGGALPASFTVTVPTDPDGGTYTISGALDLSNSNGANTNTGQGAVGYNSNTNPAT